MQATSADNYPPDKGFKIEVEQEALEVTARNTHTVKLMRDGLMDWMKGLLKHSFVLGNKYDSYETTMKYIEGLINDHRLKPNGSKLSSLVPQVGLFHTPLHLVEAFYMYNSKYSITCRRHIPPTFSEIRHILNLAQVLAINVNLRMVSFDGDQTLYSDGGNFEEKSGLSYQIIELIKSGINVVVITAANYQDQGPQYEVRLSGLLRRFMKSNLTEEEIKRFHVMGGECHYLLRAQIIDNEARLNAIPKDIWQASHLKGPKPMLWDNSARDNFLDIAEASFRQSQEEMKIRCRILRKVTSVGMIPGGESYIAKYPSGHGNNKIKQEVLNEVIQRSLSVINCIETPLPFPYCAFNGGRDCWVDVGSKGVGVEALQAYFDITSNQCMHIGDQFLETGNDWATRAASTTIWIDNPNETFKILEHILRFSLGSDKQERASARMKSEAAEIEVDNCSGSTGTGSGSGVRGVGKTHQDIDDADGETINIFKTPSSQQPITRMNVYTGMMEEPAADDAK